MHRPCGPTQTSALHSVAPPSYTLVLIPASASCLAVQMTYFNKNKTSVCPCSNPWASCYHQSYNCCTRPRAPGPGHLAGSLALRGSLPSPPPASSDLPGAGSVVSPGRAPRSCHIALLCSLTALTGRIVSVSLQTQWWKNKTHVHSGGGSPAEAGLGLAHWTSGYLLN